AGLLPLALLLRALTGAAADESGPGRGLRGAGRPHCGRAWAAGGADRHGGAGRAPGPGGPGPHAAWGAGASVLLPRARRLPDDHPAAQPGPAGHLPLHRRAVPQGAGGHDLRLVSLYEELGLADDLFVTGGASPEVFATVEERVERLLA